METNNQSPYNFSPQHSLKGNSSHGLWWYRAPVTREQPVKTALLRAWLSLGGNILGSNGVNSPPSPGEHGIMGGSKSKVAYGDIFRLMRGELRSHLDGFSMTGGFRRTCKSRYPLWYAVSTAHNWAFLFFREGMHTWVTLANNATHTHLS